MQSVTLEKELLGAIAQLLIRKHLKYILTCIIYILNVIQQFIWIQIVL